VDGFERPAHSEFTLHGAGESGAFDFSALGDPAGDPISAFSLAAAARVWPPLCVRKDELQHGVYVGATMASETTAATTGGWAFARDPMAMLALLRL